MALHMTSRHCPGRRSWLLENDSIDAPMEGEHGQVVDHSGSSWNLLLADLRSLSIIVEKAGEAMSARGEVASSAEESSDRAVSTVDPSRTRAGVIRR